MSINQLESNLEAITRTIAKLEKDGCTDEKVLKVYEQSGNLLRIIVKNDDIFCIKNSSKSIQSEV